MRILMRGIKIGRKKGGGKVTLNDVFQTKAEDEDDTIWNNKLERNKCIVFLSVLSFAYLKKLMICMLKDIEILEGLTFNYCIKIRGNSTSKCSS